VASKEQIRSHRLNHLLKLMLINPDRNLVNESLALGVTYATAKDYERAVLEKYNKIMRRNESR